MSKFYSQLDETLRRFIERQKIFFTATAPTTGRINLSPKGMDTFRCLDERTVAYLDLTGSGNETAAHAFETGRMTVMFCSFSAKPLILRLYGNARVIQPQDAQWNEFYSNFEPMTGERQIIVLDVESAQTSCGYGVPVFELKEERQQLINWAEKKGEDGLRDYRATKNVTSIDGLPTHIND